MPKKIKLPLKYISTISNPKEKNKNFKKSKIVKKMSPLQIKKCVNHR